MRRTWLLCLGLMAIAGCKTEVTFENQVPNATLQNVRWVTDDGTVYAPDPDDPLEPGQRSEPVLINQPDEGDTGRLELELVVEGRKVALVTDRRYTAEFNENSVFKITPSTAARNRVTSSAGP